MTSVVPCSISNILLFPGTALDLGKAKSSARCNLLRKSSKRTIRFEGFVLRPAASVSLFSQYRRGRALNQKFHILSATETEVTVDEAESPVADESSTGASETPANAETSGESSVKPAASSSGPARSTRFVRKSEMPPVKNEDLVPGAVFTGKVRSIQPFGAFVDIGAFSEGLVHVSQLSDSFVEDVGSVVSIGQEVKVRVVEANFETKRLSLSMREDDGRKPTRQRESSGSSGPSGSPRSTRRAPPRSDRNKKSSFAIGETLVGTVKNLTRSGAFISLPEEEEGFLPRSEENVEGFDDFTATSSLVVGEEVKVRVLRISRGQATLTMKKEGAELVDGVVYSGANPFVVSFRKNKDIAAFLDERKKLKETTTIPEEAKISEETEKVDLKKTESDTTEAQDLTASTDVGITSAPTLLDESVEEEEASSKEADVSALTIENEEVSSEISASSSSEADAAALTIENEEASSEISASSSEADVAALTIGNEEASSEILASSSEADVAAITIENEEASSEISASSSEADVAAITIENEEASSEILASPEGSVSITDPIIEAPPKEEEVIDKKPEATGDTPPEVVSTDSPIGQVEESQADNGALKDELQVQAAAVETEISAVTPVEEEPAPIPNKNDSITSSDGQPETKAAISPSLVKQLREETGAGMMDCKNALLETEGDIARAQELLRKKGLASAEKKASRATAEGRIGSYIHDGRIGVLVEVNCETDFVSRGDIFKELVDDIAMQVAACPQVQYLTTEDIPEEIVNKEREIEMQKEDLLSKPEQMRSRIVDGRIKKRLDELALLEQSYIKSDKVVVKDWVKQTIATVGENMKVKRFVRFNLGEGLEKKSQDFAAEVAAQTAAKPVAAPEKEQPAPVQAEEAVEKPPAVAVSAALVKQLREETGAGMMDCKKALSETGGDLEKAQEFLRKKGLSTADKKSSRLAAEGRIGSYIHDSRIGVLIEVNCETDFVGRSEKFKELVDDLAMQVVASPQVQFVSIEDISESAVQKEKELEMQREDLLSKPENIREKIVEGRVAKRLGELALLEQPFIKDDNILVKDLVKQTIAALGENIKVRRFVRFTLGETN